MQSKHFAAAIRTICEMATVEFMKAIIETWIFREEEDSDGDDCEGDVFEEEKDDEDEDTDIESEEDIVEIFELF